MNEIELIQKHLAGQLPASAQNDFNERLAKEPSLQEKVAEYKMIFDGFRSLKAEAFEEEIKTWNTDESSTESLGFATANTQKTAKIFSIRKIAVAASFILLVALAGTWYLHNPVENFLDDNLEFLVADKVDRNGIANGDAFAKDYVLAHQYNDAMEFDKAAQTFEKLLQYPDIPKAYSKDYLHWKKIVSLLAQYEIDQDETAKEALLQGINDFLPNANETDIYRDKAIELKKILE